MLSSVVMLDTSNVFAVLLAVFGVESLSSLVPHAAMLAHNARLANAATVFHMFFIALSLFRRQCAY